MRVLISGQAALAFTLDAPYQIHPLDGPTKPVADRDVALRLFAGCSDLEEVSARSLEEIASLTEEAWAKDRSVRLFLFVIDPHEDLEDLREYAECVEELIGSSAVRDHLRWTLTAGPLPVLVEVNRVRNALLGLPAVQLVFEELLKLQGVLIRLQEQFSRVHDDQFDGKLVRERLWRSLVADGSIHSLATQLEGGQDISFLRLQIANKHLAERAVIAQWTAMLQTGVQRLRPKLQLPETTDEDDWAEDEGAAPGNNREAYEQIRAKQSHIIEQLKIRDLENARRLTELLIEGQRSNSTSEQIAKSLSLLSQAAKLQEVPELQLEWAQWAARENPADPRAYGQLADALITVGRYNEAEVALNSVEGAGGRLFAESGRARILGALGKFDEARAKYLEAAQEFEGAKDAHLSWYHAAECLREIGQSDQAIIEFQELTNRFPLSAEIWSGYANALLDVGRIDEAIVNFGRSLANSRRNPSAANGRASAYRQAGRFTEAQEIYDQVIADFPNNSHALCGRAEVLRLKGQFEASLQAYDVAIERCPFGTRPLNGKASVLLELERHQQARDLYYSTYRKFPNDTFALLGLIRTNASMGFYEDALTLVDEHLRQTPLSIPARLQRAKLLFRMGQPDAALADMDILTQEHPTNLSIASAKAGLLIGMNKIDEAAALLPDARPKTQLEWNRHLLRIVVLEAQLGKGAASGRLHQALTTCPFFAQRKLLRSALVSLELGRGRKRDARRIVESAPTEVTNVISMHVFAAAHRTGHARKLYEEIIGGDAGPAIISLAEEIARRTGIVSEAPRYEFQWVAQQERLNLVAEAA